MAAKPLRHAHLALAGLALCAVLAPSTVPAAHASAQTSASISPLLTTNAHGAGALDFTIHFTDESSELGVPAPVRHALLRFPVGLNIEIPQLRSCSATRLRKRGPSSCPPQSHLGNGEALAEVHAGSQVLAERVRLWVFLGPLHNLSPTFLILGRGYTPFDEQVVISGSVVPDSSPFGEDLSMAIPPIPTLPLEPDASIVSMSLTVGSTAAGSSHATTVLVPRHCPAQGLPFAATFTYADGSTGEAAATTRCPR